MPLIQTSRRFIADAADVRDMTGDDVVDESTVSDRYAVTIPSPVRDRLDIEPGDTVRWRVTEAGELSVEVVKRQFGVLADFEPADMGETHAAEDHDLVAADPRDRSE